jgi:hypothetical protein
MRTSEQRARDNGKGLTEDDVRVIRALPRPLKPIAEQFGISVPMVSKIRSRQNWKSVKDPPQWIG